MSDLTTRPRALRPVLVLGIVLIVIGLALPTVLRGTVVTYPGDAFQDTTVHATGTASLLIDPATLAPQAQPGRALPVDLQRRVHTLNTVDGTAIVEADDALGIDNLPPQHFVQRYTIDKTTARNVVSSSPAFAFTPPNIVDRSPAYTVSFPFNAGMGPYSVWVDEVGQSIPYTYVGAGSIDGLRVNRYRGVLADGPLQPAFLNQLASEGLAPTATFSQLRPQLIAAGVDVDQFINVALRQLDPPDQQAVTAALAMPIPLDYRLAIDSQLSVEPWTGTIVSQDHVDEAVSERPDFAGIGRIYAIITQDKYAAKHDVTAAAADLARLLGTPPTTKLITETYVQTAPSTADVAAKAGQWADRIVLLTVILPIVLGVVGLLMCLTAGWLLRRRRT